jgi:MFS superfamily sulfate permease-like transporter
MPGLPACRLRSAYTATCWVGLGYALLGSSRQLAIEPTSAISLMIASTVAAMAEGDAQRYAQIASLAAFTGGNDGRHPGRPAHSQRARAAAARCGRDRSAGCLLLAYIESVSAARTFAAKHGYALDPRQELLGLGAANLAAAFGQGKQAGCRNRQ